MRENVCRSWRALAAVACCVLVGLIAESAAAVEVKATGRLYANFHYNLSGYPDWDPRSEDNDRAEFAIDRAYLGVKGRFTDQWSAAIVADISRTEETEVEAVYDDETGELVDDLCL